MKKNPCLLVDAYKLGHYFQMPPGVQVVYSTWTARSARHHMDGKYDHTVVFGHQGFIKDVLVDWFNENFFNADIDEIERDFTRKVNAVFHPKYASFDRFRDLHNLGYLPIAIYGVPEGTLLPVNIPDHVIVNTDTEFAWLPQYLEDIWSCRLWLPTTSATTAYYRRKEILSYAELMCDDPIVATRHMCGDFSMRGMENEDAAYVSTAGHLLSFDRTATVEGNAYLEQFYDAIIDYDNAPGIGIPSLEHSVVCQNVAYYKEQLAIGVPEYMQPYVKKAMRDNWEPNLIAEMCFILRLLTEVQPEGVLTYVSDTYDYWGVVSKILPTIKGVILSRKGCFSIRPDSGDPIKIITGDPNAEPGSPAFKGTLYMLREIFGGFINDKGYFVLNPHIRMIYGDAITSEITESVCKWCAYESKISIENIAFGIGAYTYQYVTRDTRGYAIKATNAVFDDIGEVPLYKAPKTDPGKRSPRGCVAVFKDDRGIIQMVDGLDLVQSLNYPGQMLVPKFEDGEVLNSESIYTIQNRLWEGKF